MSFVLESQLGNCSVALELVGYASPTDFATLDEANWLVVRFVVMTWQGSWSAEDACLLTWEVEDLIRWSRGGYSLEPLIVFRDPSLEFHIQGGKNERLALQVTASGRLLPNWREGEPITLDLIVSPLDLRGFAADLESNLAQFPYRHIGDRL